MPLLKTRPARHSQLILGGVVVDPIDPEGALDAVDRRLAQARGVPLVLASANLDHIQYFGRASALRHALSESGVRWLVLLDGMPFVWMANRLTGGAHQQVAGSDLLPPVLAMSARRGAKIGLLGGAPEMQARLTTVLQERFDGLTLSGCWSPTREELADTRRAAQLAEEVRRARIDLLVVALGKPRQECWLAEYGDAAGIKVGLAFGAAVDFLAGVATRAPLRWRRYGLEWLYRLIHEPRRLGARYLLHGPVNVVRLVLHSAVEVPSVTVSSDGGTRHVVGNHSDSAPAA